MVGPLCCWFKSHDGASIVAFVLEYNRCQKKRKKRLVMSLSKTCAEQHFPKNSSFPYTSRGGNSHVEFHGIMQSPNCPNFTSTPTGKKKPNATSSGCKITLGHMNMLATWIVLISATASVVDHCL